MRTREQDVEPFVNLSELAEIELLIMRRMREFTIGEHRSVFHGTGFDYVGLRDWEAGDAGEPLVESDPESDSARAITAIAEAIAGAKREQGVGIVKPLPLVS